jgi:multidrug efflux system outer membrane protein
VVGTLLGHRRPAVVALFDGGQRAAQEEGARARLEAAMAAHRGQVLTAFGEVEDQLSALRLLEGQAEAQGRAVQSARRATQLSDCATATVW